MVQTITVLQWHIDNGEHYEDHHFWRPTRFYTTKEEAIADLPACLKHTYISGDGINDFVEEPTLAKDQVAFYRAKTPNIAEKPYLALRKVELAITDTVKTEIGGSHE